MVSVVVAAVVEVAVEAVAEAAGVLPSVVAVAAALVAVEGALAPGQGLGPWDSVLLGVLDQHCQAALRTSWMRWPAAIPWGS